MNPLTLSRQRATACTQYRYGRGGAGTQQTARHYPKPYPRRNIQGKLTIRFDFDTFDSRRTLYINSNERDAQEQGRGGAFSRGAAAPSADARSTPAIDIALPLTACRAHGGRTTQIARIPLACKQSRGRDAARRQGGKGRGAERGKGEEGDAGAEFPPDSSEQPTGRAPPQTPERRTIRSCSDVARCAGSTASAHLRKWWNAGVQRGGSRSEGMPAVVMRRSARSGGSES
jgi:hypothetical protein